MIGDIVFLSLPQAKRYKPNGAACCVSIMNTNDGRANLTRKYYNGILRLNFDDATEETKGLLPGDLPDLMQGHEAGRRIVLDGDELCDMNDAMRIFNFLSHAANLAEVVELVVHCEAGISRSAAVAMFAADRFGGQVVNTNRDTSGANKRLLRLLNKVANNADPVVGELPEGYLEMKKSHTYNKLGMF